MKPFIDPQAEIEKVLSKYREEPVCLELKNKIYDELAALKLPVAAEVVLRKDPLGVHRDFVEVILETKV